MHLQLINVITIASRPMQCYHAQGNLVSIANMQFTCIDVVYPDNIIYFKQVEIFGP